MGYATGEMKIVPMHRDIAYEGEHILCRGIGRCDPYKTTLIDHWVINITEDLSPAAASRHFYVLLFHRNGVRQPKNAIKFDTARMILTKSPERIDSSLNRCRRITTPQN